MLINILLVFIKKGLINFGFRKLGNIFKRHFELFDQTGLPRDPNIEDYCKIRRTCEKYGNSKQIRQRVLKSS